MGNLGEWRKQIYQHLSLSYLSFPQVLDLQKARGWNETNQGEHKLPDDLPLEVPSFLGLHSNTDVQYIYLMKTLKTMLKVNEYFKNFH